MKIACLGWGSLIWDPRTLPVRRPWFTDGPLLPIEFARHSGGDRITLVIVRGVAPVRTLWALMSVSDLETAKRELAQREGTPKRNIGYWSPASKSGEDEVVDAMEHWAVRQGLDAVIWTALGPKFGEEIGKIPSIDEVISFLRALPHERRQYAEQYIRMAPLQIDTEYRRQIERKLNWTPIAGVYT